MAVMLAVGAVAAAGCGLLEAEEPVPPPPPPFPLNTVTNPGFESGLDGWQGVSFGVPDSFAVSEDAARTGRNGVSITLPGGLSPSAAGVAQTVPALGFPEVVSGFYRVSDWEPAEYQHLEFVLAVRGGSFADAAPMHELRFVLGGSPLTPPLTDQRVGYTMLRRAEPKTGSWEYFTFTVGDSFREHFGGVPATWEAIEFRVEIRATPQSAGATSGGGTVAFDDLYVGGSIGNPNHIDDE